MKQLIFIITLLFVGSTFAQKVNWMTMDEALAAQQVVPKKIIMDVYTVWCGPCKLMDRETFGNKKVARFINENYYPVKFNAEGPEEITYDGFTYTNPNYQPERRGRNATHFFADALRLQGYPSIVFFEDNGKLIQSIPGFRSPKEIEIYLKMIANDDYKELVTVEAWETYQKKFKGTF
ncbi:MAG: thioredoxin family protein [Flavobacteriaceae bacterium]|nr:thioredoxin family protein [Flavobacteriaceae bacterium]